jgi:hypothetical protein
MKKGRKDTPYPPTPDLIKEIFGDSNEKEVEDDASASKKRFASTHTALLCEQYSSAYSLFLSHLMITHNVYCTCDQLANRRILCVCVCLHHLKHNNTCNNTTTITRCSPNNH